MLKERKVSIVANSKLTSGCGVVHERSALAVGRGSLF